MFVEVEAPTPTPTRCAVVAFAGLALSMLPVACHSVEEQDSRFESLEVAALGIPFQNSLTYTDTLNPYTYKSFFNGGGVGLGDLNNDGSIDVILTGNQVDNGVYLNHGDWSFEDISQTSGLAAPGAWSTGVTIVDVDGDGWQDVYLCKSGPPSSRNRRNELRLNNRDGTFRDVSKELGIDVLGFSVQAVFFDYDRDGDLDFYLLSNSVRSVGKYDLRPGARDIPDSTGGNRIYRNLLVESGALAFEDVSRELGLYSSEIGFGLGVAVGDINQDNWPDLYVSNDFFERDYLYVNQGRSAGFAERLTDLVPETSLSAMGADIADLDGDGAPEIFVTEMLPRDPRRYRSKMAFESWHRRRLSERQGYHRQFSRNVLLANDGSGHFADIGRAVGVAATDWSWGALLVDLDNDGRRDIFVANGTYKDPLDQDYLRYASNDEQIRKWIAEGGDVIARLIDSMPSEAVPNFAFRQTDQLTFVDSAAEWGLAQPSFSNGSGYADLDRDGDLDLVINTANGPPLIYRNSSRERNAGTSKYLRIDLVDTISLANRQAQGSTITVYSAQSKQSTFLATAKGFQSSVEATAHFGLGASTRVDSIVVEWSSGGRQVVAGMSLLDTTLIIKRTITATLSPPADLQAGDDVRWSPAPWRHRESEHDDFERYPLLAEMHSAEGPALAVAPAQRDGQTRVFVGAAKGYASALIQLDAAGHWSSVDTNTFERYREAEDVAAIWVDVNRDAIPDLIVGAGSDESTREQYIVRPRLYLSSKNGSLTEVDGAFPGAMNGWACGALVAFDADEDGDEDLFFGTHFRLGAYGLGGRSFLLINDGQGKFTIAGGSPGLDSLDLVTDALWDDLDGDGREELLVAREFAGVTVYRVGADLTVESVAQGPAGLWRCLAVVPRKRGVGVELFAGNLGLNSSFRASVVAPLALRVGDFDGNRDRKQLITQYSGGEERLISQLHDLTSRMPSLRKRFPTYARYANSGAGEVLDFTRVDRYLPVTELRHGFLRWDGRSTVLAFVPLAGRAQWTAIRAAAFAKTDSTLYIAGNFGYGKPEFGSYMSGSGSALRLDTLESWTEVPNGFPRLNGEVRVLAKAPGGIIAARNGGRPVFFKP